MSLKAAQARSKNRNTITAREGRFAFLATCKTIYDRNRGCITSAEEAIVDLVLTYQATSSLTVDDIEFAHREFVGSAELMKAARPVPAA